MKKVNDAQWTIAERITEVEKKIDAHTALIRERRAQFASPAEVADLERSLWPLLSQRAGLLQTVRKEKA